MSMITEETRSVYTTSDDEVFTNKTLAEAHQLSLNGKAIISNLTTFLHELFEIPTAKDIRDKNDEGNELANGDEFEDNTTEMDDLYEEAERMDEKRDKFFAEKCQMLDHNYEMSTIAENFLDLYKEFGRANLKKILSFIHDSLEN